MPAVVRGEAFARVQKGRGVEAGRWTPRGNSPCIIDPRDGQLYRGAVRAIQGESECPLTARGSSGSLSRP